MGVTFTTLGARFAESLHARTVALETDAGVGYRRAFGPVTPRPPMRVSCLAALGSTRPACPCRGTSRSLNLGVRARLSDSLKVGVAYVGEYGGSYSQNGVKGNVDWSF